MKQSTPAVLILLFCVFGCSDGVAPPIGQKKGNDITISTLGSEGDVNISGGNDGKVDVNGVTITFPDSLTHKDLQVTNGQTRLIFENHSLTISDGSLEFDGAPYGKVKQGDNVALHEDGSVSVNSKVVARQ